MVHITETSFAAGRHDRCRRVRRAGLWRLRAAASDIAGKKVIFVPDFHGISLTEGWRAA